MARTYLAALALAWLLLPGPAAALTIEDVQQTDAAHNWESPYLGQTIDVTGGIVTYAAMPPGKAFARIVVQDPGLAEWAGVEVKIFDGTPPSAFPVGSRVDLSNVCVDENRGTTYLLFDGRSVGEGGYGSGMSVFSTDQVVSPTVVSPLILGYAQPIASQADEENANISAAPTEAEQYEGMLLMVTDVTLNVDPVGFGSHNDNYEMIAAGGVCWASDYMNLDRPAGEDYHPWTATGAGYDAVVGVLEQYTKDSTAHDYYQLLTRSSADFVPAPPPAMVLLAGAVALRCRRVRR
jgi:hypothetical protein